MSQATPFRKDRAILGRLSELTPEEFVALIEQLCYALEEPNTPFHGGVYAANISLDENGNVGLGEPMAEEDTRYTAEQIEYLAPEVFWKNVRTPKADIFSIGMLIYAWANGGNLPFLFPNPTASDRAEALRRRMSGEAFPPSTISKKLSRVIRKSTAFKPEDRYTSVAALHEDFRNFVAEVVADSASIAAALAELKEKQAQEGDMLANILAAAEAAAATSSDSTPVKAKTAKNNRQVKNKKTEPQEVNKKMSWRPLVAVVLIAAILMVAAVAMQFGSRGEDGTAANLNNNNTNITNTTPVVPTADPNAVADITPTPTPSAEPSFTPEDTLVITSPTPTPIPENLITLDTSKYVVNKADVSWNTAANNCMEAGYNLVTINDQNEFQGLAALADKYGLEKVWVGGFRKSGEIVWLSGESVSYLPWAKGEPSYRDTNGASEYFLMMIKNADGTWSYNDVIDDPVTSYPGAYSGKIGYIMEK